MDGRIICTIQGIISFKKLFQMIFSHQGLYIEW